MRSLLAIGVLVFLSACGDSTPGRPNVVLIVMDTTRADRCSVNGYGKPTTPRLAALAAEGAVYRQAWSPSPWTGPAHASLFTGLRPENHRFLSGRLREYLGDMPTLAAWFGDAGYRTASFSNSPFVSKEYGLVQGFDLDRRDFEDLDRPYPYAVATHRAALDWVRDCRREGRPFFLFINDYEPHFTYTPPPEWERAFVPPEIPEKDRAWGRSLHQFALAGHMLGAVPLAKGSIDILSHLYDGEIACLDHLIGEIADGLRAEGILDDTLFVVVGDHGENFGEHGLVEHLASLHRSVLHVPLVIRFPPRFPAGKVVDDLVRLEDLTPTLLQACGLPVPPALDGETLLGPTGARIARATYLPMKSAIERMRREFPRTFTAPWMDLEMRSVHDGRWHYILYSNGTHELYDLAADPGEENDLAASRPEETARLSALLPVLPGTPTSGGAPPGR